MKNSILFSSVLYLAISIGVLPGQAFATEVSEPDVDPTGNAGAFKATVDTGGGYNPHNGNATRSVTDLHVAGAPGMDGLDFTRHWNSTDESFNQLGNPGVRPFAAGGWTHSWNWSAWADYESLECSGETNPCFGGYYITHIHFITIEFPDGHTARFYFSRTNTTPPNVDPDPATPEPYPPALAGSFAVDDHLVGMDPDGNHFWLYLADGGSVYFQLFPSGYRATKVIDAHGLQTLLEYENSRLKRVAGPDGRSLYITWGSFGGTSPTVIKKVGWGRTEAALLQTVEYKYTLYSAETHVWYALTKVIYVGDFDSGQQVTANYSYIPWVSHGPGISSPSGRGPLLSYADDPRFEGAMTRIRYIFRGGPGGEPFCPSKNPIPAPGNIGPSMLYAPFPVEQELSGETGLMVSKLWIPCNGTSQTGKRTEYRGAGGRRTFYYGKAGGLEPGATYDEISNGADNWHPPESYPGSGTHGYNAGTEITRLTEFADNPDPTITPIDFHHNVMLKPWRTFDARGTLTQFTFQRGLAFPGPANNGRIREIWNRVADNTKRSFNWDVPTPGTLARD